MGYVTVAAFRTATVAEYCVGRTLTTSEATDTNLGNAIDRFSQEFDDYTGDRFGTVSESAYALDGDGSGRLLIPFRTNALYNLWTVDTDGTETLQDADAYRLRSSLDPDGARSVAFSDYVDVITMGPGLTNTYYPWCFDEGTGTVKVEADFGYSVTPPDVKFAVASLVWHHFKPQRADIDMATSWSTADISVQADADGPFRFPEVNEIANRYKRDVLLGVG